MKRELLDLDYGKIRIRYRRGNGEGRGGKGRVLEAEEIFRSEIVDFQKGVEFRSVAATLNDCGEWPHVPYF